MWQEIKQVWILWNLLNCLANNFCEQLTLVAQCFRVQYNCDITIQIPVIDIDGDNVRCRWATPDEADSIAGLLPNAYLNEVSLDISFTNSNLFNSSITVFSFIMVQLSIFNIFFNKIKLILYWNEIMSLRNKYKKSGNLQMHKPLISLKLKRSVHLFQEMKQYAVLSDKRFTYPGRHFLFIFVVVFSHLYGDLYYIFNQDESHKVTKLSSVNLKSHLPFRNDVK